MPRRAHKAPALTVSFGARAATGRGVASREISPHPPAEDRRGCVLREQGDSCDRKRADRQLQRTARRIRKRRGDYTMAQQQATDQTLRSGHTPTRSSLVQSPGWAIMNSPTTGWPMPTTEECGSLFDQFKHLSDHPGDLMGSTAQNSTVEWLRAEHGSGTDGAKRCRWTLSPRVGHETVYSRPPRPPKWRAKSDSAGQTTLARPETAASTPGQVVSQQRDATAPGSVAGLRLDQLHAIATLLWPEPSLPTGVMELAHAVQDHIGDGWVQSSEVLRLILRYAVFFAQHWELFEVVKKHCAPANAHGVRSLRKRDFVQGYVTLTGNMAEMTAGEQDATTACFEVNGEGHAAPVALTASATAAVVAGAGFDTIPATNTPRQPAAVSWLSYCRWVASRCVADAFLVPDTITRPAAYPPFASLQQPIFFARATLLQFLVQLGPATPPKIAPKPWEHAVANQRGHSSMLDTARKWTERLESRAKKSADARKRLYTWATGLLEQEAERASACGKQHEQRSSTARCAKNPPEVRSAPVTETAAQTVVAIADMPGKQGFASRSASVSVTRDTNFCNNDLTREGQGVMTADHDRVMRSMRENRTVARQDARMIPRPPQEPVRVTDSHQLDIATDDESPITVRGLLAGKCI